MISKVPHHWHLRMNGFVEDNLTLEFLVRCFSDELHEHAAVDYTLLEKAVIF
jgi:hypothetical protein